MADHDPIDRNVRQGSFLTSRAGFVLIAFLAIVGVLLTTEHRAHALGALFWLLILACPLLHIFMHGRHEGHTDDVTGGQGRRQITKETAHEH
ncbi:MAG: DUF2933 domain-containing protein [Hyphomonadaceae bacterium]|jgi:hypothetical protein|nr:DUF2933 domain-containing protein [Hyphomonadaceae bacterium]